MLFRDEKCLLVVVAGFILKVEEATWFRFVGLKGKHFSKRNGFVSFWRLYG